MVAFIQQIWNLLVNPPGNLVYHMVLTFSVAGALQASLNHWQRSRLPQSRRMVIGLSLLLAIRLVLFFGAGAAWQGLLPAVYLPPVERAFTLLSLILILWLWIFPEPLRLADAATILLILLTFILMALGLVWLTAQGQDQAYNGSWLDLSGEGVILAILVGGIVALLMRRPNGWGYGLSMLLALAAGHIVHLLFLQPGDYSGATRLAEMAAYPLLLILPQRFPLPAVESQPQPRPTGQRRRFGAEPELIRAFLALATETDPDKRCQWITSAVAHTMLAELCLLAVPSGPEGQVNLACGYDLIREMKLDSASFSGKSIPVIESVLRNGRALRLPANSTSPDLLSLAQTLKLEGVGNFLAVPILTPEGAALAEIILLSPYSSRAWDSDDQAFLADLVVPLAQLLQPQPQDASEEAPEKPALADIDQAHWEREDLQAQLGSLQEQLKQEHLQVQNLTAAISVQEEARQNAEKDAQEATLTINNLTAENERIRQARGRSLLSTMTAPGNNGVEFSEGEYHLALEEIARLRMALAEAERKNLPGGGGLQDSPASGEEGDAPA